MKELYKISDHTKRIISVLMLFIQMRCIGLVSNTFNSKSVKKYHEIIESFSEFLHDEGIDDPQQIYEYYNYSMWNGYFSRNHKLQYTVDRVVYIDNAGMSIMSGNAVCLNYADMLSLIFQEMGFKSYTVMCYVNPDNINAEKIRTDKDTERDIDSSSTRFLDKFLDNIFIKTITKLAGNHAITCVENNDELYFFDPTNLIYLNKTGINNVSIINGEGKFDLKYLTSLLFENINIFKVITYKNKTDYNQTVIEKPIIDINIYELEEFYKNQKENIENVAKNNDKNISLLSMMLYSLIASNIIILITKIIIRLVNKFEGDDLTYLFPKLKEYFNEKNIKTEFETLKNYEIIEKELGIKDDILKDILKRSIAILDILINDRKYHHLILSLCLNHLGYNATFCYAEKITNKFIKKNIPLIIYFDEDKIYIYDYETEELLYRDNDNKIYSLDGKYQYKLIDDKYNNQKYNHGNKETIQNKMNNENSTLTKKDIKTLKKNKTLRH